MYCVEPTVILKAMVIKLVPLTDYQKAVLCDPQTSGGLLIAVKPESEAEILEIAKKPVLSLARSVY